MFNPNDVNETIESLTMILFFNDTKDDVLVNVDQIYGFRKEQLPQLRDHFTNWNIVYKQRKNGFDQIELTRK